MKRVDQWRGWRMLKPNLELVLLRGRIWVTCVYSRSRCKDPSTSIRPGVCFGVVSWGGPHNWRWRKSRSNRRACDGVYGLHVQGRYWEFIRSSQGCNVLDADVCKHFQFRVLNEKSDETYLYLFERMLLMLEQRRIPFWRPEDES